MQKLKKIDEHTNVITWFEIPVLDTSRAKKFYETILDVKMRTVPIGDEELTFFPSDPNVIQATSGRVTGVLTKSATAKPSKEGTLIYLNAYPDIQTVIDKIEPAGGKLLQSRTQIPAGYIAVFLDSEGNRMAIHAEE
jgi:predicted enzyme related to lactoylglutathione lyase